LLHLSADAAANVAVVAADVAAAAAAAVVVDWSSIVRHSLLPLLYFCFMLA